MQTETHVNIIVDVIVNWELLCGIGTLYVTDHRVLLVVDIGLQLVE